MAKKRIIRKKDLNEIISAIDAAEKKARGIYSRALEHGLSEKRAKEIHNEYLAAIITVVAYDNLVGFCEDKGLASHTISDLISSRIKGEAIKKIS